MAAKGFVFAARRNPLKSGGCYVLGQIVADIIDEGTQFRHHLLAAGIIEKEARGRGGMVGEQQFEFARLGPGLGGRLRAHAHSDAGRSGERRVWNERNSPCRSRWRPYSQKK